MGERTLRVEQGWVLRIINFKYVHSRSIELDIYVKGNDGFLTGTT